MSTKKKKKKETMTAGVRGKDRRLLYFLVRQQSVEHRGQRASSQLMGTSSEQGPGPALTKGAATDAIISASCRYNGAGQPKL